MSLTLLNITFIWNSGISDYLSWSAVNKAHNSFFNLFIFAFFCYLFFRLQVLASIR